MDIFKTQKKTEVVYNNTFGAELVLFMIIVHNTCFSSSYITYIYMNFSSVQLVVI